MKLHTGLRKKYAALEKTNPLLRTLHLRRELRKFEKTATFLSQFTPPSWRTVIDSVLLAGFSANNNGNWSTEEYTHQRSNTREYEHQLVKKLAEIYGDVSYEGYATSGTTESLIFFHWAARTYFETKGIEPARMLSIGTSLSHHAVKKAANVTSVPFRFTPLSKKTWSMSPKGLFETAKAAQKSGVRAIIVTVTHGYTLTGTHDDLEALEKIAQKIESSLGVQVVFCVDAALEGLVQPFLSKNYTPLNYTHVMGYAVDFHKVAGIPHPAGVALYHPAFRAGIEHDIMYLPYSDTTLSGSRSGITPYLALNWLEHESKRHTALIKKALAKKREWIQSQQGAVDYKSVTHPTSLTCGVVYLKNQNHYIKEYALKPVQLLFEPGITLSLTMDKVFFVPNQQTGIASAGIESLSENS